MANLYAAVADLPARAVRDRAPGSEAPARLPALERLLARGAVASAAADWRRWALGVAGLTAQVGDLPLGRLLAQAHGLEGQSSGSWLIASPLRLGAGLTALYVEDPQVRLSADVAARLALRFNAEWQGSCELLVAGGVLLLNERAALEVTTVDPALLEGADLAAALPRGRDAPALIRRMTEIQMWLHGTAEPGLNALWLWGAGQGSLEGRAAWPALLTPDPALAAARAVHPGTAATPAAELAHFACAEVLAAGLPLAAADARWFVPLAAALAQGEVERAELHFAGHAIRLSGRQRFRWWRRVRPWWEFAR